MAIGLVIAVVSVLGLGVALLAYARPTQYENKSDPASGTPLSLEKRDQSHCPVSVQILVLGDIGHSPRMQYHALSVAKHGGRVSIIGYQKSTPNTELLSHPFVSIIPLSTPPNFLQTSNKYLFPILALLKVIHQTWCLWKALAYGSSPAQWMLVQNPPAAPTLVVAQLACFLRNTRLVIDWHNFGYSILALKLGANHPIIKLMKLYEVSSCHYATAHFCVSNAMARVLREEMKIKAPVLVLHDRPAAIFRPMTSDKERQDFLASCPETSPAVKALMSGSCRLLVSSTSWTPDEDFSILLDAMCQYSAIASAGHSSLPSLLVIITGKGPQKDFYLSKIAALTAKGKLTGVTVKTAWLTPHDYASLLAAACLGVCLHTSSSGVDLPMKVVDMFGAGLPVVGWNKYPSWPELVSEGVNGRGFASADELASHMIDLFGGDSNTLKNLRDGAVVESKRRWDGQWDPIAGKLFQLTT